MAAEEGAPDELLNFLDGRIVVPGVGGLGLVGAAGLLWAGTHGSVGGLLTLYYGGILAIAIGVALAFVVGVFVLGTISLVGLLWLVLERLALLLGPGFGWVSPVLLVAGLLLLPGSVRRLRTAAEDHRRFAALKGGSVPP